MVEAPPSEPPQVIKKYIPYHDQKWGVDESDPIIQKRCWTQQMAFVITWACSQIMPNYSCNKKWVGDDDDDDDDDENIPRWWPCEFV